MQASPTPHPVTMLIGFLLSSLSFLGSSHSRTTLLGQLAAFGLGFKDAADLYFIFLFPLTSNANNFLFRMNNVASKKLELLCFVLDSSNWLLG